MQLRDALSDLKEIRAQLDRTSGFRGFRSLAVGFSGILALVGATVQFRLQSNWQGSLAEFMVIWMIVALASLLTAIVEMWIRGSQSETSRVWRAHRKLAAQIAPSFFVGAVITAAIVFGAQAIWMLPGIWALVYSLGLFACVQLLPRLSIWAAAYYLVGGTVYLVHCFAAGELNSHLSAWYMGLIFGGGQLLLGWILYWTLERRDGKDE